MSLSNFSSPFTASLGSHLTSWSATISPLHPVHQQLTLTNDNLLYLPSDHQPPQRQDDVDQPYRNDPYAPPAAFNRRNSKHHHYQHQHPIQDHHPATTSPSHPETLHQSQHFLTQIHQFHRRGEEQRISVTAGRRRSGGGGAYLPPTNAAQTKSSHSVDTQQLESRLLLPPPASDRDTGSYSTPHVTMTHPHKDENDAKDSISAAHDYQQPASAAINFPSRLNTNLGENGQRKSQANPSRGGTEEVKTGTSADYPGRPVSFTRVEAGQGGHTRLHAIIDYDLDEGEEEADEDGGETGRDYDYRGEVTPVQGPIFLRNGSVPVVPLFSYPVLNNGTFLQIPIWWTALSVAIGYDLTGNIIKGVPCIKRNYQLYCPTAGNKYPIEKIEHFIDENKALIKRMFGNFEMKPGNGPDDTGGGPEGKGGRVRRYIDEPNMEQFQDYIERGSSYFGKFREKRQANRGGQGGARTATNSIPKPPAGKNLTSGREDICQAKTEILTPYWASNASGKIRAVVNTQHFEQAIHQEICKKTQTSRCKGDCGCEQKYKWHRLLAYDPDNDCKGIFMDWFLFPSCCVCRCNP